MHHQRVAVPQLVAQLADRLDIRQRLDAVSYTHLGWTELLVTPVENDEPRAV